MTTIVTDRLILRMPQRSDFPAYRDFYASDRTRYIGGPSDDATAWRSFAADAGHWALFGFGWFTIVGRKGLDEAPLGTVGLHHPPHHADAEIGWSLYPAGAGNGYATEAAAAVLRWARSEAKAGRIVSYIHEDNAASKTVARRLGARLLDERAAHDGHCEIWLHADEGAEADERG